MNKSKVAKLVVSAKIIGKSSLSEAAETDSVCLGQMAIEVESGNLWLNAAATRMDHYMQKPTIKEGEHFIIYANMMRTAIEQICTEVINLCQKCVGARGLNKPYHFGRIIRDLSTYLRQPAPDAVLADVGKCLLHSNISSGKIWDLSFNKTKS
ncbi:acyl-CoA dehydrogenase family protein [Sphingobacterium kitahiroshimense]|uniref:Acyl-CoA dehydrogenase family protein n=1 Tax=Sphingobacterium kitahiroshimense TaxID=470446 RepID=A0ABV0BZY4_9SPHI